MPTMQPSYVSVWTSSDYQSYPTITLDPNLSVAATSSAGGGTKKNKKLFTKHLNRYIQMYNSQLRQQSSVLKNENATSSAASMNLIHAIIDENHKRTAKKKELKVRNHINNQIISSNACLVNSTLYLNNIHNSESVVNESLAKLIQKYPAV
jgi:hypothetical protein